MLAFGVMFWLFYVLIAANACIAVNAFYQNVLVRRWRDCGIAAGWFFLMVGVVVLSWYLYHSLPP